MIGRLIALALMALAATTTNARAQEGERAQMVVELFTSQGCTQCPRANRLLGMFAREDDVLALTFPVGIWDYLGWHDTYARPEYGDRQRAYSRSLRVRGRFTPQLVFNGARQISASDWDQARATYDAQRADGWPAAAPDLAISRLRNNRVRVTVGARSNAPQADVWLIAYDPGPLTVVVTGGANRNRSVAHYNLVKWIERLDGWNGRSAWYERPRCQPECAVIVQEPNGGRILAAAYTYREGRY
ncbi:MAG TPA: DUF1223 domain-containing protein [Vitreimonas sp.]|uniref:DUF1223 domain-containing protein n=1 Tax=Vitreimonas sp. TaxID=3069702 RepID=UPI002D42797A|nr:DUF1223 domain-containing protein [Vitreimonas sp.]HYD88454.1 DUF1223 domain-containing protein [Vitreimonas sp.]